MKIQCTRLTSPPDDQTEETLVSIVRAVVLADCSKILYVSLHVPLLAVITLSFICFQDEEGCDSPFRSI